MTENAQLALFDKLIIEVQKGLVNAYRAQNMENIESSVKSLGNIFVYFHILGALTDKMSLFDEVIKQNREILPQSVLNLIYGFANKNNPNFNDNVFENRNEEITSGSNSKSRGKQLRMKWTADENRLFYEGIEKFGVKGKEKDCFVLFFSLVFVGRNREN